ncbi:GAF domain-containing protein [Roseomonas terrae]|jgi:GAF domain-containing protein|uniref:GAF domain-containing protein n=1 Tax=Neoroseomonas terrae TaxID=424799 RepID=A0ABS5EB04_9PROT|nr:GAF domain-containing protein [Neoroseomonas terrae]MBR0648198.1 GAF domain-containing protein [Neoroseomonas terrae]
MTRPDPLPSLRRAADALAAAGQADSFFVALQQAMGEAIGHRLFTIMRHDPAAGRNRRAFSSDPAAYPVSGYKAVNWDHPWTQRVLVEGQAWIGRDAADIAWAYPDHQTIAGMGLASAMNLPVRWDGRTLGAVNLLHGPGHFTDADAAIGTLFAALAVPALLAVRID